MLPTCPACKQSVLDDDATECPFCGANMKTGKGGTAGGKPAAPPKAAPKAASAPAAASSSKPASSGGKSSSTSSQKSMLDDDDDDPFNAAEDDDPFAAATREAAASKASAIAVSPKKTKTHVVELKCPMCDTMGFVPEKAGGKDVKCCNPKCTVPVFMAPKNLAPPVQVVDPKTVKAKAKEKSGPTKMPLILAISGGVALVAVTGGVLFFWDSLFSAPATNPGRFVMPGGDPGKKHIAEGPVDPPSEGPKDPNETPVQKTAAEQLDIAFLLQLMQDNSVDEKPVNKKYCRQRTAIAFAATGNPEGMRKQFQTLDQIDITLQHFKIPAYLTHGWKQLSKGDKAGAGKTADEAVAATANIGKGSRDTQEAVIDLAALLVATGKTDIAKKLLSENLKVDDSTQLVVELALARHRRDFDLDQEVAGRTGNPQRAWPEVGVTLILASEGLWAESQVWADAVPNVEAKTDCLVAWADARLRDALTKKQAPDAGVEGAAEKLSPAGKVQLLARLAITQAKAGNKSEAERLISAAQQVLKTIPVPSMARCDGFKEALDWKAPEIIGLRQAALGAASIGLAQAELKKLDEGWISTIEGLKYARGMAPSPTAVAAVKQAGEDLGLDGLRDKVRALLNLRARDEAVRKTRELQNKLSDLEKLADERFRLQEAMMINAANAGMSKLAWQEALSLSQRKDPNEVEPYLSGRLPEHLISQFNKAGMSTEAEEVAQKVDAGQLGADEVFALQEIVDAAIQSGNFAEAIDAFNQRKLSGGTERVALAGFLRAAKREGQALPVLGLLETMTVSNQFVKLEALRMLGAFAALQNDPAKVLDAIQKKKMGFMEKISGDLGLIEGYLARPAAAPEPTPDPASGKEKSEPVKKDA